MRSRSAGFVESVAVAGLLLLAQASSAASLAATAADGTISPGGTTTVSVSLDLGTLEVASVFQGTIQLVGVPSGTTAAITDPAVIGPTWPDAVQNVDGDQVSLSLTSSNAGDERLLASFEITAAEEPGTLDVLVMDGAFAQMDTASPPYVADIPIDNTGQVLVQITIAPEPGRCLMLAAGAGALLVAGRARRRH